MLYGYNVCDVNLPILDAIKCTLSVSSRGRGEPDVAPVAYSLGLVSSRYANPRPDRRACWNKISGLCKRLGRQCGPYSDDFLCGLIEFADAYVRRTYEPLPADADLSVASWLENTHYSVSRRVGLLREARDAGFNPVDSGSGSLDWKRLDRVAAFVKSESYSDYKYPRLINSRTDYAKCVYGPIAKSIERVIYSCDAHFIKHVPVPARPGFIRRSMPGSSVYLESDYSAFESHFTPELMLACELILYRHMLSRISNYHGLDLRDCENVVRLFSPILGRNRMRAGDVRMCVDGTRMSGEMFTSLGNGFSNLILMEYILARRGIQGVRGFVEGDDGLFAVPARYRDRIPTEEDFAALGFHVKLAVRERIEEASFCGMVYDVNTGHIIRPVVSTLLDLGWHDRKVSNVQKRTGLLYAKCLSTLYECPGCPILAPLAAAVCDWCGARVKYPNWSSYQRDEYKCELLDGIYDWLRRGRPSPVVEDADRELVEKLQRIPVGLQRRCEERACRGVREAECLEDLGRILDSSEFTELFELCCTEGQRLYGEGYISRCEGELGDTLSSGRRPRGIPDWLFLQPGEGERKEVGYGKRAREVLGTAECLGVLSDHCLRHWYHSQPDSHPGPTYRFSDTDRPRRRRSGLGMVASRDPCDCRARADSRRGRAVPAMLGYHASADDGDVEGTMADELRDQADGGKCYGRRHCGDVTQAPGERALERILRTAAEMGCDTDGVDDGMLVGYPVGQQADGDVEQSILRLVGVDSV